MDHKPAPAGHAEGFEQGLRRGEEMARAKILAEVKSAISTMDSVVELCTDIRCPHTLRCPTCAAFTDAKTWVLAAIGGQ